MLYMIITGNGVFENILWWLHHDEPPRVFCVYSGNVSSSLPGKTI